MQYICTKIKEVYGTVKEVYTTPVSDGSTEINMIIDPYSTKEFGNSISCPNENGQFKKGQEVVFIEYKWQRPTTEYDKKILKHLYNMKCPESIEEFEHVTYDAQEYRKGLCNESEILGEKQAAKLLKIEEENKQLQNKSAGRTR